jgi:hypothetical protein
VPSRGSPNDKIGDEIEALFGSGPDRGRCPASANRWIRWPSRRVSAPGRTSPVSCVRVEGEYARTSFAKVETFAVATGTT